MFTVKIIQHDSDIHDTIYVYRMYPAALRLGELGVGNKDAEVVDTLSGTQQDVWASQWTYQRWLSNSPTWWTAWWFQTWVLFFHILGISSSQLTKSIIFHFIYGMSSQPHWRTHEASFFKMGILHHQPVVFAWNSRSKSRVELNSHTPIQQSVLQDPSSLNGRSSGSDWMELRSLVPYV